VLGACVPPAVADAYCVAPARATAGGVCAPPPCGADEAVDVEDGCVPTAGIAHGAHGCDAKSALLVENRRAGCVPPDAACPRGTTAVAGACASPPSCPPGALPAPGGAGCRSVVAQNPRGTSVIDVGAWAATVLGRDGGDGADELCRPLAARPAAFGLASGGSMLLRLEIRLTFPDEEIAGVRSSVRVAPAGTALPAAAENLVQRAVGSLVEPLRSLGGEASATAVEVGVRCKVESR
jgi:hypothetical protein